MIRSMTIPILSLLALVSLTAPAQESPASHHAKLSLSPEVRTLLRAEMREISGAIQRIAPAIAIGDLEAVAQVSEQIGASYLMEQQLSESQREELQMLPEHFQRLDGRFHEDAARLKQAADADDAELAAFRYYRLVDSCVACHTVYAQHRFPGLRAAPTHDH